MPLYLQVSARKKGGSWNSYPSFFQSLNLFNLDVAKVFAQAVFVSFSNGWTNL